MLEAIARKKRVTHPSSESLIPFALGADDPATARHVERCVTCRTEIEQLRETAGLLRGSALLDRRTETTDCPDELVIADFVDGRMTADQRAPVVTHLLTCARCRSFVKATGRLVAETAEAAQPSARRWRRWSVPVGLAAAAALVLLLVPRNGDDGSTPDMREPTVTSTIAPVPIVPPPGASVARVDRMVWSSVPGAERYRLRLYDGEGSVLWSVETADTSTALPDSVRLTPRVPYFWRVEAQAEWMRWAASDLVSFWLAGPRR
jgi:anti-sigma factor ChrR (cupin superfamily)